MIVLVRALLSAVLVAIGCLVVIGPDAAQASPVLEKRVIGHSVDGRPIVAYHLGNPTIKQVDLVIGQMHGDEPAGIKVVDSLIHSTLRIKGVNLWVIATMNPDGNAAHTRQNAHGVDLNRNWPHSWRHLTGQYYSGPKALSEPETRAVYRFLLKIKPHYFVSLHQPLDGVDTTDGGSVDPAFRNRLAHNLGLPKKALTCWSACHGNMTGWYTQHHYGVAITVEFGWHPSTAYLTGRVRRGIVHAMGGVFGA